MEVQYNLNVTNITYVTQALTIKCNINCVLLNYPRLIRFKVNHTMHLKLNVKKKLIFAFMSLFNEIEKKIFDVCIHITF